MNECKACEGTGIEEGEEWNGTQCRACHGRKFDIERCDSGCIKNGEPDIDCPVHGLGGRDELNERTEQIMDEWRVGKLGNL